MGMVTVTGWGKPSDSAGGISPVLREVRDIPVITNSDCNDVYGIVGDGVVCIDTTGGRGSCNGDSGGPLVQMAGGKAAGDKWTQVGIVSFGAHNVRASSEPNRVEVTSYNGWTHPMWNSNDLSGDLALVELPSPLPMNDYISASCLPAAGEPPAVGSMVTVTGWGKPSDSAGGISPVLREVRDIPVITNSDCNDVYGIVGDGVVCIDTTGGHGSCNGDSGGPLVQMAGGKAAGDKWTQVGIVSFGASAGCEVGMPAGFTRTEYYLDWIRSETGMP